MSPTSGGRRGEARGCEGSRHVNTSESEHWWRGVVALSAQVAQVMPCSCVVSVAWPYLLVEGQFSRALSLFKH